MQRSIRRDSLDQQRRCSGSPTSDGLKPGMLAASDMTEQPPVRRILISSTAVDPPEHRRQAATRASA